MDALGSLIQGESETQCGKPWAQSQYLGAPTSGDSDPITW